MFGRGSAYMPAPSYNIIRQLSGAQRAASGLADWFRATSRVSAGVSANGGSRGRYADLLASVSRFVWLFGVSASVELRTR